MYPWAVHSTPLAVKVPGQIEVCPQTGMFNYCSSLGQLFHPSVVVTEQYNQQVKREVVTILCRVIKVYYQPSQSDFNL